MRYLVTSPWWLRLFFPSGMIWNMPRKDKVIYLTFDDGPHPAVTPFVLDCLKTFNARATFFCIGKNVIQHPEIYKRILAEGHSTGNHTHTHLHAGKVSNHLWLDDAKEAATYIDSDLFRPPYGRITRSGAAALKREGPPYRIILWDVLSGDFDESISAERCIKNVTDNGKHGSVVVFHDSAKARPRLELALPEILKYYADRGFRFEAIK